ncbi:putative gag-polypeptide of LTR copia-type [Lupinus albus]|uniref:Putative gag-polypeptide of LTR copia-type n=1 Tax=Lupinus albus TaxID=3870 RepID=A0A6A4QJE9_LUPAL|nr:putative gag-polypeptide of LTR copia-type [Lupinus albus]
MDPSQDPSSIYYIHPSDSTATPLVSPLLNGENYHQWVRSMKMSLITKQKIEFIDESIQMPPKTDPSFKAWQRANNMVISWITRSVDPSISQSVLWSDKAYEIWDELGERFTQGNLIRIGDLQELVFNYKQ